MTGVVVATDEHENPQRIDSQLRFEPCDVVDWAVVIQRRGARPGEYARASLGEVARPDLDRARTLVGALLAAALVGAVVTTLVAVDARI
jgi:hypothetical protein